MFVHTCSNKHLCIRSLSVLELVLHKVNYLHNASVVDFFFEVTAEVGI